MSSHRDPARYQQVKDVLLHALDAAPDKRSEYLNSACANDPALREEVELLLAAYDEASRSFLNGPPGVSGDQSTAADDDVDLTGARLGAYRLDRLLGRGGMGTVYLASRDDGEFVKRVAIKVIR